MSTLALSRDAQAIALLCSRLALPREGGPKPFGPAEWNRFAGLLRSSDFGRPGDLLGRTASDLSTELPIAPPDAQRIDALLSRGVQLALEVERLANRGMWILTRADADYPGRLKRRLRGAAPPLFFGSGSRSLLDAGGVAVVGSRDADEDALTFARDVGRSCARERQPVVSGAARGVDITAMLGALDAGGTAVGIAAEALERLVHRRELREPLTDGSLVMVSPHHPGARFHAGNAMRRNRLIYCAADVAVVVASAAERGGTRAGALEALEAGWVPVVVRDDGTPGNMDLARRGAQLVSDPSSVLKVPHHAAASSLLDLDQGAQAEPRPDEHPPGEPAPLAPRTEHPDPQSGDVFDTVWPLLAALLAQPRTETEVASQLALERSQARAWLSRAVEQGLVRREGRRRTYVLSDQQPLV